MWCDFAASVQPTPNLASCPAGDRVGVGDTGGCPLRRRTLCRASPDYLGTSRASPWAAIWLIRCAQAHAVLAGTPTSHLMT